MILALTIQIATTVEELHEQEKEIQDTYDACCTGWMAYDDALCLARNNIRMPCKTNSDTQRFQRLDVGASLHLARSLIKFGSKCMEKEELQDAIIFWRLAFHVTKIIQEVKLPFQKLTLLLAGQYTLFRVIVSQKASLKNVVENELARYAPIIKPNSRPIVMPKAPREGDDSTEAEALRAVLSCEITRPTVPLASVIGQRTAYVTFENELVLPYVHKNAFISDKKKKGILLYGPPGNGKVDRYMSFLLFISQS